MKPIRLINRIEFKGPNLIKGLEFEGNRCLGKLEDFCKIYSKHNFDEFFFYDIVASLYDQDFSFDTLKKFSSFFSVPVTYCGGIRTIKDIEKALNCGAEKVSINTHLFKDKSFLKDAVNNFGSPTLISNIEYYFDGHKYILLTEFGRSKIENYDLFDWINFLNDNEIGEIHLLDVAKDGLGEDPDIEFINKILSKVNVPVVYGCGLGDKSKYLELSKNTNLSGISAASIFHYDIQLDSNLPFASYEGPDLRKGKEIDSGNIEFIKYGYGGFRDIFVNPISIDDLKKYLFDNGVNVRI